MSDIIDAGIKQRHTHSKIHLQIGVRAEAMPKLPNCVVAPLVMHERLPHLCLNQISIYQLVREALCCAERLWNQLPSCS